jgi:hypothetical protein
MMSVITLSLHESSLAKKTRELRISCETSYLNILWKNIHTKKIEKQKNI